jgi:hypothetical protein
MPLTRGAGAKLAEERGPHDGTALRRCLPYDTLVVGSAEVGVQKCRRNDRENPGL